MKGAPFRLRELPFAIRLSITCLVLVNLGGYLASGLFVRAHHANRDERAGLSLVDLEGAYHGVRSGSALVLALEANHPSELGDIAGAPQNAEAERRALLDWLASERISEDYDNLDLDPAPADLLDALCLPCHSRNAPEDARAEPLLDFWDDVRPLAFSRELAPVDAKILLASTHAHAIALATITLLVVLLTCATAWPEPLKGGLALAASAGLLVDLASWWLARESAPLVKLVVAGGALHALAMGAMMLLVIAELWRPRRG